MKYANYSSGLMNIPCEDNREANLAILLNFGKETAPVSS